MFSSQQLEIDLQQAIKARDHIAADALRSLKSRIEYEQIAKGVEELKEDDLIALVRSEIKKRKEAAAGFALGERFEQEEKEHLEAQIFEKYLPPQMSEEELSKMVEEVVAEGNFTAKDFGPAMGKLKAKAGISADGAVLAKLLKEKLK